MGWSGPRRIRDTDQSIGENERAGPERAGSKLLHAAFSRMRFRLCGDCLAVQCRQGRLAVSGMGRAERKRASVSGRHPLNIRGQKTADRHGGQNCDLRYHFCTHLHGLAPWEPGEFLLGVQPTQVPYPEHEAFQSRAHLLEGSDLGAGAEN